MHTTNNVPQSRCTAFLIYGGVSEMGRWSERRWRHAEGLHVSLFSPHKQAVARTRCRHTPTHRSLTQTDAGTHHPHRARPPAATVLMPHTGISTFPSAVPLRRATHNYPTETQLTGKSAEFDRTQLRILGNELPHVGWLHLGGPYVGMNMHVNLSHRQQAASRMPKVSSVRSEALALCWALGGCAAVFRRRGLTGNHADAGVLGALVEDNIDWKAGLLGVFWFSPATNSVISQVNCIYCIILTRTSLLYANLIVILLAATTESTLAGLSLNVQEWTAWTENNHSRTSYLLIILFFFLVACVHRTSACHVLMRPCWKVIGCR